LFIMKMEWSRTAAVYYEIEVQKDRSCLLRKSSGVGPQMFITKVKWSSTAAVYYKIKAE
jgi:hypothetical protein